MSKRTWMHLTSVRRTLGFSLLAAAVGCHAVEPPAPDGFGHTIVQRFGAVSSSPAAPLGAATLDVAADGSLAVAADPDRDAVFIVDLVTDEVRRIDTAPGDELGQVLIVGEKAFVLARGTGEILRIDLETAAIEERFFVAEGPRSFALDSSGMLHVACASGELVSFDAETKARTRRVLLDADLRDVVVWGNGLAVSRLRSAEVLFLDGTGTLLERFDPGEQGRGESTVAWRLRVVGTSLVLAHQYASSFVVPIGTNGYGSDFCGGGGITTAVVTVVAKDGRLPSETAEAGGVVRPTGDHAPLAISSAELLGTAGALDFAGIDTSSILVTAPGNAWATARHKALVTASMPTTGSTASMEGCDPDLEATPEPLAPVTIAVARATGRIVTQSREPALLQIDRSRTILLSDEPRPDVGHRLFHMTTSLGISCASCHPEGRDDGHPWNFDQLGMRRSQSLRGGISELAPFHWDGSLPEFTDLMGEVFRTRMGLDIEPTTDEVERMVDWLDRLPPGEHGPEVDADSAARGEALFMSPEVGCSSCHSGPRFADQAAHDVGTGGVFFTPPLTDIGTRPPYMHDSCAPTLKARFGACGGDDRHGVTSHLEPSQIDDLVSFMMTL